MRISIGGMSALPWGASVTGGEGIVAGQSLRRRNFSTRFFRSAPNFFRTHPRVVTTPGLFSVAPVPWLCPVLRRLLPGVVCFPASGYRVCERA